MRVPSHAKLRPDSRMAQGMISKRAGRIATRFSIQAGKGFAELLELSKSGLVPLLPKMHA